MKHTLVLAHVFALALVAACAPKASTGEAPAPPAASAAAAASTAPSRVVTEHLHSDALGVDKSVQVYLPRGYDAQPGRRWPVFYYLHGLGGDETNWVSRGKLDAAADQLALAAIVVMPDGDDSFYVDSALPIDFDQCKKDGAGLFNPGHEPFDTACVRTRAYETYVARDLVGWVDAHYRTIARRDGRAIAGLSMGGFGAVRYAEDRPGSFAYVASFSGAVDLKDYGTRGVISEQAGQNGFNPYGPFGNPFPGFDATYNAVDPVSRAARLQGVGVALYVGSGNTNYDAIEGTMAKSAAKMDQALTAAGVPHFYWNYGRPGPTAPYGCDGGHNFGCWNFAFKDALPRIVGALQAPTG